jgi:hypothetical protein
VPIAPLKIPLPPLIVAIVVKTRSVGLNKVTSLPFSVPRSAAIVSMSVRASVLVPPIATGMLVNTSAVVPFSIQLCLIVPAVVVALVIVTSWSAFMFNTIPGPGSEPSKVCPLTTANSIEHAPRRKEARIRFIAR